MSPERIGERRGKEDRKRLIKAFCYSMEKHCIKTRGFCICRCCFCFFISFFFFPINLIYIISDMFYPNSDYSDYFFASAT